LRGVSGKIRALAARILQLLNIAAQAASPRKPLSAYISENTHLGTVFAYKLMSMSTAVTMRSMALPAERRPVR
jgi:hypothetical protein